MRKWSSALALLVLATGCGGDGGEEAVSTTSTTEQTTTTEVETTTTTEPVDPFTVPDDPADITEAYVEAVINEHNRVIGDALRIQLEGGDPNEIIARYNAIYVPEVADGLLTSIFNTDEEILATIRRPPGDPTVEVLMLRSVASECVEAEVLVDYSKVLTDAPAPAPDTVVLRRADETTIHNETIWLSEGVIPGIDPGDEGC